MEMVKLCTCTAVIIGSSKSIFNQGLHTELIALRFIEELREAIYENPIETVKVCVPAVIYTLQNNLYYIALTHLEATTFCVLYANSRSL
ncbi:hypothetical protein ANCCAN_22524 [Ancylostoma caninum]|uniref:Uncharacterized protein n=1 Tax=Ancylostoma caninum TaxID=29170 RepID=A0A368FHZ8_ANCCA|nr:hypothetical protein ANCCAN_22524 [Ancylostoma caninum]